MNIPKKSLTPQHPVSISVPKGRVMLHWNDKRPPNDLQFYPPQLVKSFKTDTAASSPTWEVMQKNWHNLLMQGENREVLYSMLSNGFAGKIDLVYIDPPFASGNDFTREVVLRGSQGKKVETQGSLLEKKQYGDMWKDDTYLQYMYERLILLRELLSEQGSIYLHCDEKKNYHLRFLMDEVFGTDNFQREIIWVMPRPSGYKTRAENWIRNHETILFYTKNNDEKNVFNKQYEEYEEEYLENFNKIDEEGKKYWERDGRKRYMKAGYTISDVWTKIPSMQNQSVSKSEGVGFPTQKPEALIELIIEASSNEDSLVLDCFCGSGTTAAVAERLGRRWIACDIKKDAVDITANRLLNPIQRKGDLESPKPPRAFAYYRINNYENLSVEEKKSLVRKKYGIANRSGNPNFDGVFQDKLVKFAEPFNIPLSPLHIAQIKRSLANSDETRDILLIGDGEETSVLDAVSDHNRTVIINKIELLNIQNDGVSESKFETKVSFKDKGDNVIVTIKKFVSHAIMQQLNKKKGEDIDDFRSTIDYILIDNNYDSRKFNVFLEDIPKKKEDFVEGTYSVPKPAPNSVIAVKIVDMLGEETLVLSTA